MERHGSSGTQRFVLQCALLVTLVPLLFTYSHPLTQMRPAGALDRVEAAGGRLPAYGLPACGLPVNLPACGLPVNPPAP